MPTNSLSNSSTTHLPRALGANMTLPTNSLTTQNSGDSMTIVSNPQFRDAYLFNGIACSNLRTARLYAGTDIRLKSFVPTEKKVAEMVVNLPCQLFCTSTGSFYLVYRFDDEDLRVDVANEKTGRLIRDRGVTYSQVMDLVFNSPRNDWRAHNGWGTFQ